MATTKGRKRTRAAGLVAIALFLVFAYVAVTSGSKVIKDEKLVTLLVTDALGLVDNSSVMIAGVEVGYVKNLSVAHDKAKIVIALDPEELIPRRVKGIVRARSLLGEKFLELVPIDSKPGGPLMEGGEEIGSEHTSKTLEIDQFTTDFDPLIERLGSFLDRINPPDPDKPNLIDNLAKATGSLAHGLDGKEKEISQLVDNLNDVTGRIDGIIERNSKRGGRVFENLDAVLVDTTRSQIVPRFSETAAKLSGVAAEIKEEETIPKVDKVLVRLDPILARAEKLDETALRKFLQIEGVKAHIRYW